MTIKQEIERNEELKGKDWIDEYNHIIKRATKRQSELIKLQSLYDSQQDDILHYLEMMKCDAIKSSKLMKALKEIRAKRRLVKEELSAVNSITMLAKQSKYINNETYVYKTNVVVELLEESIKKED
jgi:hypothetical protein